LALKLQKGAEMSQIFDALRKSENERNGSDRSSPSEATELLRAAERKAASKWGVANSANSRAVEENRREGEIPQLEAASITARVDESSIDDNPTILEEWLSIVGQFQTLKASPEPESRLVCLTEPESPAAEAFRLLGVRMREIRRERLLKTLLITSTIPQEGKSMVSANLACALAKTTKQRVLLLEGDLRRPSLSAKLGIGSNPGICEWFQEKYSLMTVIYHLENAGIWIMPGGSLPESLPDVIQSGRLVALMEQLSAWFDWIIVDSPPVLPLADTSVWTNFADGILLVTRQGTTEKRQLKRGLEAIDAGKIIGAILNESNSVPHSDYYYGRPSQSN
jgi:capsular exopolysaccharide synthesis family protein